MERLGIRDVVVGATFDVTYDDDIGITFDDDIGWFVCSLLQLPPRSAKLALGVQRLRA